MISSVSLLCSTHVFEIQILFVTYTDIHCMMCNEMHCTTVGAVVTVANLTGAFFKL